MSRRLSARTRHASATLLVWIGSLVLGLADAMYAGIVPGPRAVLDDTALALAGTAGVLFVVAGLRGLATRRAAPATAPAGGAMAPGRRRLRLPLSPRLRRRGDAIAREADRGIVAIEAWLARQDHSRDG